MIISDSIKTTYIDFISALGGTMGLFLGMSFLSLIELIEILMDVIFIMCEKDTKVENLNNF